MTQVISTLTRAQIDAIHHLNYHVPRPLYVIEKEIRVKRSPEYKNLLDIYKRTPPDVIEEGKLWYRKANALATHLANKYSLTVEQVASVISCLSPAAKWDRTLTDAENLIKAYYHRGYIGAQAVTVTTYGKQKVKALEVLSGRLKMQPKQGHKTYNFMHNILDPSSDQFVTIDRHAWRVLKGIKDTGEVAISPKQYAFAWHVYRNAAKALSLNPCELQAITWVQYINETKQKV